MKLTHRIRMFFLLRKADALRERMNRPHMPSRHVVDGVRRDDEDFGWMPTSRVWLVVFALLFFVLILKNVRSEAKTVVSPQACTQTK